MSNTTTTCTALVADTNRSLETISSQSDITIDGTTGEQVMKIATEDNNTAEAVHQKVGDFLIPQDVR